MADYGAVNEVYARFFPKDPPARSAMAGSGLAFGAKVEIECMALAGREPDSNSERSGRFRAARRIPYVNSLVTPVSLTSGVMAVAGLSFCVRASAMAAATSPAREAEAKPSTVEPDPEVVTP